MPVASKGRRCDPDELTLAYHQDLVSRVTGDCVLNVLQGQLYWMCELASNLSAEQIDKVHKPYAWSIRQVIEHCVNAERIGGDRILRLAAGDKTDLTAWDENAYADARFGLGNVSHLISELGHLRQSTLCLLARIRPAAWDERGTVDSHRITVRGMAWVTAAHLQHHFEIIESRCEIQVSRGPSSSDTQGPSTANAQMS